MSIPLCWVAHSASYLHANLGTCAGSYLFHSVNTRNDSRAARRLARARRFRDTDCRLRKRCLRNTDLHPIERSDAVRHTQPRYGTAHPFAVRSGNRQELQQTSPGHAEGGTLYDPKSGKTYRGEMTASGNALALRGYIGLKVFGRTETWTRTQAATPCIVQS